MITRALMITHAFMVMYSHYDCSHVGNTWQASTAVGLSCTIFTHTRIISAVLAISLILYDLCRQLPLHQPAASSIPSIP
jgi:hypothetical protein